MADVLFGFLCDKWSGMHVCSVAGPLPADYEVNQRVAMTTALVLRIKKNNSENTVYICRSRADIYAVSAQISGCARVHGLSVEVVDAYSLKVGGHQIRLVSNETNVGILRSQDFSRVVADNHDAITGQIDILLAPFYYGGSKFVFINHGGNTVGSYSSSFQTEVPGI